MKIYTSNFSRTTNITHRSISVSKPSWDNSIDTIDELVPKWEWVEEWNKVKKLQECEEKASVRNRYIKNYREKLIQLGIVKIRRLLNDSDVLCCWCAKDDFCHRQILADYLRMYNIEVEEI